MEKLSFKTKFSYGLAGVGDASQYTLIGTFLMFFLTTIAGINPVTAGTITALGAVWEAIWGPIVGYLSDNTESKFGRRKPYLLGIAFPMAVIVSLTFMAIDASYTVKVIYYTVMVLGFWTCFSTFFIPFLTWGAELTRDYNERTLLRSYASFFNAVGMTIGMVLPTMIVDFLMNMGLSQSQGWHGAATFVGVVGGLSIFISAMCIKDSKEQEYLDAKATGKELPKFKRPTLHLKDIFGMFKNYIEVLHLKSIIYLMLASIFYLIGYSIFNADRMYFFTFNVNMTPYEISGVMAYMTLLGMFFAPLVLKISKHLDKRVTYILCMLIMCASMAAFRVIGLDTIPKMLVLFTLYGVGNYAYWQLMPAMLYDVCEVDELAFGKKRAGAVISLQALSESISTGMGFQLLGIILQMAGFDGEAASQTPQALFWVENSLTILPALFGILSVLMVVLYPVTRSKYAEVIQALKDREQGKTVDMSKFKKLM